MALVTFDEDTQTFDSTETSSDPIADGVDEFLFQINDEMQESEVLDDVLSQDNQASDSVDVVSSDAYVDEASQEDVYVEMPDTVEDSQEGETYFSASVLDYLDSLDYEVYSSVPSTASFSPTAWQINLAQNRQLGEHYLMYAVRRTSGSSYYWDYFLVLGRDISYDSDIYTYSDCDVYNYYNYNSTVFYEFSVDSGTINGSQSLVYSDLYFDYVGVDPVDNSYPYISFAILIIIFVSILIGGRRHV